MSLCILAAGKTMSVAATVFTLSWAHSVEGTQWQELWSVSAMGLQIIEARIKGSGAGMEPADDAMPSHGWWVYRPHLPVQERILLAASGKTRSGWTICANGECQTLGATEGEPLILKPCRPR
jgi:hypothetical protein